MDLLIVSVVTGGIVCSLCLVLRWLVSRYKREE